MNDGYLKVWSLGSQLQIHFRRANYNMSGSGGRASGRDMTSSFMASSKMIDNPSAEEESTSYLGTWAPTI